VSRIPPWLQCRFLDWARRLGASLPMRIMHHGLGSLAPPHTRMWHDTFVHHTRAPLDLVIPTAASVLACSEPCKAKPVGGRQMAASLDRSCARRQLEVWVGTKKRLPGRTKKLRDEKVDRTLGAPP